jgi:hypothetical protein
MYVLSVLSVEPVWHWVDVKVGQLDIIGFQYHKHNMAIYVYKIRQFGVQKYKLIYQLSYYIE